MAIRDCLDYGKNPEKNKDKYRSAYECDQATVAKEKPAPRLRQVVPRKWALRCEEPETPEQE